MSFIHSKKKCLYFRVLAAPSPKCAITQLQSMLPTIAHVNEPTHQGIPFDTYEEFKHAFHSRPLGSQRTARHDGTSDHCASGQRNVTSVQEFESRPAR